MERRIDASAAAPFAMIPRLLHLGYPTAASSYVQARFAAHPETICPRDGIAAYANVFTVIEAAIAGMAREALPMSEEPLYAPFQAEYPFEI